MCEAEKQVKTLYPNATVLESFNDGYSVRLEPSGVHTATASTKESAWQLAVDAINKNMFGHLGMEYEEFVKSISPSAGLRRENPEIDSNYYISSTTGIKLCNLKDTKEEAWRSAALGPVLRSEHIRRLNAHFILQLDRYLKAVEYLQNLEKYPVDVTSTDEKDPIEYQPQDLDLGSRDW